MSAFDSFFFIDETISRLKLGIYGEKSPHAYLFCGIDGVGKRSLAEICSRAVNCMGRGEKPCDECPSCVQYLASTHPDHIVLEYQGKATGIASVRSLIERLGYKPFEDGSYTVIIERADKMTDQAQNALLKTLEDPPSSAVFFLLSENEQSILPTIKSRCRLMRIPPLTRDECAEVLVKKGVSQIRARLLASVSAGSVGKALQLDADEEYWQMRKRVLSALSLVKGPEDVCTASFAVKDDSPRALAVVDIIEQAAHSALMAQEGVDTSDEIELYIKPDRLLSGCVTLRRMLASNVSWLPAFEKAIFEAIV